MSHNVGSESLYRSATMSLIQLFIPSEVAHATVSELGELGNVQFKDVSAIGGTLRRA
jgi:V-type H+-transporting ATPase subunit a